MARIVKGSSAATPVPAAGATTVTRTPAPTAGQRRMAARVAAGRNPVAMGLYGGRNLDNATGIRPGIAYQMRRATPQPTTSTTRVVRGSSATPTATAPATRTTRAAATPTATMQPFQSGLGQFQSAPRNRSAGAAATTQPAAAARRPAAAPPMTLPPMPIARSGGFRSGLGGFLRSVPK